MLALEKGKVMPQPNIRPMTRNDLDAVVEIEHKSFTIPWTRGMLEDELFNPNAIYRVLEADGVVRGYAGLWKILNEGHITNVAVHPEYRRYGYGRLLIEDLIKNAADSGIVALTLEVRVSNIAAISLYQSFGFRTEGRRKRYYPDNQEDALIMWLHMGK